MTVLPPAPPKESRWVWILLALGFILTSFFGFRAMRSFARVRTYRFQPGTTDVEAIRLWMTVPFLARAFNVPKDYLYQQIEVPVFGSDQKSLGELNRKYFPKQPDLVLQKVKGAIRSHLQILTPQKSPAP